MVDSTTDWVKDTEAAADSHDDKSDNGDDDESPAWYCCPVA